MLCPQVELRRYQGHRQAFFRRGLELCRLRGPDGTSGREQLKEIPRTRTQTRTHTHSHTHTHTHSHTHTHTHTHTHQASMREARSATAAASVCEQDEKRSTASSIALASDCKIGNIVAPSPPRRARTAAESSETALLTRLRSASWAACTARPWRANRRSAASVHRSRKVVS
jgi:hypothetical protein